MIQEHDRIILTSNIPEEGLKAGDVGTVLHVHRGGEAFEVEFLTLVGETVAVTTLSASQVRSVTNRDITHARPREMRV
jgi:hypothetical protein